MHKSVFEDILSKREQILPSRVDPFSEGKHARSHKTVSPLITGGKSIKRIPLKLERKKKYLPTMKLTVFSTNP